MRQFNSITIEQYNNKKGVTLVELLIAVVIFSLIVVGFSNIDTFSRYYVISSDRRAKLQNDASYVLEHMEKNITGTNTLGGAIGDINQPPVNLTTIGGDNAITVWIDANINGTRDASDKQIAYRYSPASNYEIWYYPNYTDAPAAYEVITSKKIRPDFSSSIAQPTYCTYNSANNYIEVQITACWDPDGSPTACGGLDNPAFVIKNRIYMPAVSTH